MDAGKTLPASNTFAKDKVGALKVAVVMSV